MGSLIVTCPGCQKRLKVRGSVPRDKSVACPKCGFQFYPGALSVEMSVPVGMSLEQPARRNRREALLAVGIAGALLLAAVAFFCGRGSADTGVAVPSVAVASAAPTLPVCATPTTDTPCPPSAPVPPAHSRTTAEFHRQMIQGNDALAHGDLEAALRSYSRAHDLFPEDVQAATALNNTRAALASDTSTCETTITDSDATYSTAPGSVDLESSQSLFAHLMNQGEVAMLKGDYDGAQTAYTKVLDLAPDTGCPTDSGAALDGLRNAGYVKAMTNADTDMRAGHYTAAVHDYQDALLKVPGDANASQGLLQARSFSLSH